MQVGSAVVQNYGNWKFSMEMVLVHEDLWDCISGEQRVDGHRYCACPVLFL